MAGLLHGACNGLSVYISLSLSLYVCVQIYTPIKYYDYVCEGTPALPIGVTTCERFVRGQRLSRVSDETRNVSSVPSVCVCVLCVGC